MPDTGSNHILIACHIRIQSLINIIRCLLQRCIERVRIRSTQIQEINGFIQNRLNILTVLIVLIHTAKCLKRYLQVVIQLCNLCIHLAHIHKQLEFLMKGSRISLQFQDKLFSAHSALPKENFPVVHIDSLGGNSVYK